MTAGRAHHARRPARRGGLDARAPGQGLHPDRPAERRAGHRAHRGPHRLQPGRASTWASPPSTPSPTSGSGSSAAATSSCSPTTASCGRIDTFLDERSGYFFEMNPSGLMADARVRRQRHEPRVGRHLERARPPQRDRLDDRDRNPLPHAQLRSRQRHLGHQLPAHGPPQERRQHLDGMGAQPGPAAHDQRRPRHGHQRRHAGHRPRHQAVRPLRRRAVARPRRRAAGIATRNAGVDLFYNPTPGLRANLTINTDFAQTEVDQRQVNLTRFSLFFPERRDFFLDGATFFDFASNNDRRRAGAARSSAGASASAPTATPQRIDFGTKFTGQVGGQDVGLLHVRTGDDDDERLHRRGLHGGAGEAAHAARSPTSAASTRGATRAATARGASHTVGFDLRLATSRSSAAREPRRRRAGSCTTSRPDVTQRHQRLRRRRRLSRTTAGPSASTPARCRRNFDPAVGFVARRNYRRYNQFASFGPRPRNSRVVRQFSFTGDLDVHHRPAQRAAGAQRRPDAARTCSSRGRTTFAVELDRNYERLDAPFAISPGITLPLGSEYTFTRFARQRADGQPPHAGAQRPLRDRRLLLGHAPADGRWA